MVHVDIGAGLSMLIDFEVADDFGDVRERHLQILAKFNSSFDLSRRERASLSNNSHTDAVPVVSLRVRACVVERTALMDHTIRLRIWLLPFPLLASHEAVGNQKVITNASPPAFLMPAIDRLYITVVRDSDMDDDRIDVVWFECRHVTRRGGSCRVRG